MNELFWLTTAILFSLFQSREVRGDRRRTIETWLRNLLGIGVGVHFLVSFLLIVPALFEAVQSPQSLMTLMNICSLFFAFAIAGLLCLYRKIFWFATTVVFSLWALPVNSAGLVLALAGGDSVMNLLNLTIAGILLPATLLGLMGYYYFQYVRVAR